MKKKLIYSVIALQVVILLVLLFKFLFFEETTWDISYADYVRTTIPDDRDGWYIDTTFPCLEDGLFVYSDYLAMEPGVYRITARYESDSSKSYSTVKANTNAYIGLFADQTPLPNQLNEVSYHVYLLDETNDFSVRFHFGKEGYLIAKDIQIVKTNKLLRIQIFLWILFSICVDVLLYGIYKYGTFADFLYEKRAFVFIVLGAMFVSNPIFTGFMRYGIDIGFHLTRIEGLKIELLRGQLPVKMQTIWCYGYGYPVSLYYGDLFLVIPAFLRIVGFSVQMSYHVLLFLINFATIAIAYWSCHQVCRNRVISYVCAMLYALMPYRLSNMYQRSALGETIAMTFLPLIAFGILAALTYEIESEKYKKLWIPLVLGFTGIIQSHILTCVLVAYVIIFVCILQIKKVFQKDRFFVLAKTVIYTSLLNAWFVFPCMFSMEHLDISQPYKGKLLIQGSGARLEELFTFWTDGNITVKGIGFCLGLGLFIHIYVWCKWNKKMSKQGLFFWMLSIMTLFASTVYFPWNKLALLLGEYSGLVNKIQFSTRLLGISAAMAMFCLCFTLHELQLQNYKKEIKYVAYILLIVGLIAAEYNIQTGNKNGDMLTVYDYAKLGRTDFCVAEYVYYEDDNYTNEDWFRTKLKLDELVPGLVTASENVAFVNYQKEGTATYLHCDSLSDAEGYIELSLLFYEQYVAAADTGEHLQTCYGNNHRLRVIIPADFSGDIVVDYKRPLWWRVCDVVSALAWLGVLIMLIRDNKKRVVEK